MADDDQPASAARDLVAGEGNIRERTIRFGNVILAIDNIDSVALAMRPRGVGAIMSVAATLAAIFAAAAQAVTDDLRVSSAAFVVIVALGAAIAWLRPAESYLAVGVSGGRTYYVGSKHKEFLIRLGELIRRKIDEEDPKLLVEFSAAENVIRVAGAPAPQND
jgi:hypothetical protein